MLVDLESYTDTATVMQADSAFVMGSYARQPIVFVRGEGARLRASFPGSGNTSLRAPDRE